MNIPFVKYHALGNDFLTVESKTPWTRALGRKLAFRICDRKTGVGADGVLLISPSKKAERRIDVFNADGSWAEKSGNGLRIAALHCLRKYRTRKSIVFEIGGRLDEVTILKRTKTGATVRANLGSPDFRASSVPIKSKSPYVINLPVKIGKTPVRLTALAVGNPHAVVVVDNFDFDWQSLGCAIETAPVFPNHTNVEFTRVINRRKIQVAEWERGVGPTGSSGTGAAASVAACVTLGLVERKCEVKFEPGSLHIEWDTRTGSMLLTGPVELVMSGEFVIA
ncbi:MAG: diaminopimelate epimerase [Candidatus Zixiibacteriota bacterium]